MKKININRGFYLAIAVWLVNGAVMPLLPDSIRELFVGISNVSIILFDYGKLVLSWGSFLALVWLPLVFKSASIYAKRGLGVTVKFVLGSLVIIILVLGSILRLLIN